MSNNTWKLWDFVLISKFEDAETGKVEIVRTRAQRFSAEDVVDDIKTWLGTRHDSDIFFNGLKIGALDRNAFYRAAQGDIEALDYVRTLNDVPKKFTGRPGDKLDMTREEFAELFPVDCNQLQSSDAGLIPSNWMIPDPTAGRVLPKADLETLERRWAA